jgi:hypothetical protein
MFQPRNLIWRGIEETAPAAELDEIRRKIGGTLIDQVNTMIEMRTAVLTISVKLFESALYFSLQNTELHAEVKALAEILSDFQQQNDTLRDEIQQRPVLPEPPAKAMIERQIVLILQNLKVRSESRQSTLEDELTPVLTNPRDRDVLEHVASNHDQVSISPTLLNPGSSTPRSGRATIGIGGVRPYSAGRLRPRTSDSMSSSSSSRPSTAMSSRSAPMPSDFLNAAAGLEKNLTIYDIDSILGALRDSFKEEKQRLREDIEFLTECLEEESEVRAETECQGKGNPQVRVWVRVWVWVRCFHLRLHHACRSVCVRGKVLSYDLRTIVVGNNRFVLLQLIFRSSFFPPNPNPNPNLLFPRLAFYDGSTQFLWKVRGPLDFAR